MAARVGYELFISKAEKWDRNYMNQFIIESAKLSITEFFNRHQTSGAAPQYNGDDSPANLSSSNIRRRESLSKADDAKQEFNNPIGAWHDFTQFAWHHPQTYWKQSLEKASNKDHCFSPQPR